LLCDYRSPHSGTVDSDTEGMLHAGEASLHDDAHGLTAAAAADAEASASVALDPPHNTELHVPVMPPSVATQSAVYEDPGEDGRPVFRGFQDPKSQSQTFKKLQNLIETGEGTTITAKSHYDRTLVIHIIH